ncbi:MAG: 2-phospho-L-lactate transferase CofD family protein [Dehalococcoidia bacterium]|nr:2-phospho-L-lactate transferase CofD family protein [Dehalococcoidia bacterium]
MAYKKSKSFTFFGGGTGLSRIFKSALLANLGNKNKLSAVVSTFDNGGSTGILRDQFQVPALGDLRKVLSACLLDQESEILKYRFEKSNLSPHTIGNLILLSFINSGCNIQEAVNKFRSLFKIDPKIFPSSLICADIISKINNITTFGEKQINDLGFTNLKFDDIYLKSNFNEPVIANQDALSIVKKSDLVIFSSGDFYTSLLPSILPEGFIDEITNNKSDSIQFLNIDISGKEIHNQISFFRKKLLGYTPSYVIYNSDINNIESLKKEFPNIEFISKDLKSKNEKTHDIEKTKKFIKTFL